MLQEINKLSNNHINEGVVDAAKSLGKGALALTKDIGATASDILAGDGINTATHFHNYKEKQKTSKEKFSNTGLTKADILKADKAFDNYTYNANDIKAYQDKISQQPLEVKKDIVQVLIDIRNETLQFEKEAKKYLKNTNESYVIIEKKAHQMIVESLATKIPDESIKKILAQLTVLHYRKNKTDLMKKIITQFKSVNLPTNDVTRKWVDVGRPAKIGTLTTFMKSIGVDDNKIYKIFRKADVDITVNDIIKLGLKVKKSSFNPLRINKKTLYRFALSLGNSFKQMQYINRLKQEIAQEESLIYYDFKD